MENIEELLKQISVRLNGMDEKLGQLVNDVSGIKQENKQLKDKIEEQEKRTELLERDIRKENLIIMGVKDEEEEGSRETLDKILNVINNIEVEIDKDKDIEDCTRIGKYRMKGTRAVLIKLGKYNKKIEILKQAKNLIGTNIGINEDYLKEVQEERKKLIPLMKEARLKGQKALIKYNKLIINNEVYEMEEKERVGRQKSQMEEKLEASNSNKRSVSERSPKEDLLDTQIRKITKTSWKKK